jgi:predicted GIY-YIG superfamily endonuclease
MPVTNDGIIYLLHFARPYKRAKHYMGFTTDLTRRLARHARGDGARLMAAVVGAGIAFELARQWPGDRNTERALKRQKDAPMLCPICNPRAMNRARNPEAKHAEA